jgi:bifunctional non-homologous end joining protein LigD
MIGSASGGEASLRTRNGRPAEDRFPEVTRALAALPFEHLVVDGEIAATDREGRPRFQRLQQRARLSRKPDVERAAIENPVTFFVFDLLAFGDLDLRDLPLSTRKRFLADLLPRRGPLRVVDYFEERGEEVYAAVLGQGLEGIVAKRLEAPYRAGRSPAWKKLRIRASDDFVVVGFSEPGGARAGFGALYLGWWVGGELVYAGRVGTGFSDQELTALRASLD